MGGFHNFIQLIRRGYFSVKLQRNLIAFYRFRGRFAIHHQGGDRFLDHPAFRTGDHEGIPYPERAGFEDKLTN